MGMDVNGVNGGHSERLEAYGESLEKRKLSRYRIISRTSPGIATEDAPDGEAESLEGTMLLHRLHRILRAGRGKATTGTQQRGDATLIEVNGIEQHQLQQMQQLLLHNQSLFIR